MDCHNCDKFILSRADLVYWHRKREQWRMLGRRAGPPRCDWRVGCALQERLGGIEQRPGADGHHLVGEGRLVEDRLHGFRVHLGQGPAGRAVTGHAPVGTQVREQQTHHVVDQITQPHHRLGRVDEIFRLMPQIHRAPVALANAGDTVHGCEPQALVMD
ncbi:hypothetical protein [Streptomyces sp. NPDC040750]|uniref:hypothetical protein n=1 Tax=Streptomyces sp. NPDC040750 TaxID=3154491 RepID=UPI0033F93E49